ncbi:MAG: Ppx/GppA family phosphatase [Candidatus Methylomirabilia bacterium]
MRRLAAIDLGTNTIRLLVAEVGDGKTWRVLVQRQTIARLGEGLHESGSLSEAAMDRSVATVAELCAEARALSAEEMVIVATSAVRRAFNQEAFLERVAKATGHAVRVIPGEEEARLALLGALHGLSQLAGRMVLFDIGGGSTEFILAHERRLVAVRSLSVGVVALAERFMTAGPVDWDRYAEMDREVRAILAGELPGFGRERRAEHLVGTAGTVTTLAALDQSLPAYDSERVHGYRLHRDRIQRLWKTLGDLPVAARATLPCLEPGRADVIIPGIATCLATMDWFGFESLLVSDYGLREGILIDRLNRPAC